MKLTGRQSRNVEDRRSDNKPMPTLKAIDSQNRRNGITEARKRMELTVPKKDSAVGKSIRDSLDRVDNERKRQAYNDNPLMSKHPLEKVSNPKGLKKHNADWNDLKAALPEIFAKDMIRGRLDGAKPSKIKKPKGK